MPDRVHAAEFTAGIDPGAASDIAGAAFLFLLESAEAGSEIGANLAPIIEKGLVPYASFPGTVVFG